MKRLLSWWIQFDAWKINCLEKIFHKIQRLTGHTHYLWLRVLLSLIGVCCIATPFLFPKAHNTPYIFFGLFCLMDSLTIPREEKEAFRRLESGLANPEKQNWLLRLLIIVIFLTVLILFIWVFMSKGVTIFDWWNFFFCGILVFLRYLFACDPLPPQRGKFREWIDSFFLKPIRVKE